MNSFVPVVCGVAGASFIYVGLRGITDERLTVQQKISRAALIGLGALCIKPFYCEFAGRFISQINPTSDSAWKSVKTVQEGIERCLVDEMLPICPRDRYIETYNCLSNMVQPIVNTTYKLEKFKREFTDMATQYCLPGSKGSEFALRYLDWSFGKRLCSLIDFYSYPSLEIQTLNLPTFCERILKEGMSI